ncbi:hypothetical protein H6P81_020383 [Aristolochia fimbriata]|uniref:RING-type E3 ubiquitin transferase n=1 Tax=Aristolochia fimbriata TaxID=158543 RepID=A0AAV7DV92_ARIFI|nr:hypothetical protein H6P81_020383 [Aristolochia fimbriata]
MEGESEKVYVAVGKNTQEGLATLEWVLKYWSSQSVSVVILHVNCGLKDFVSTPFGKLPASSVSDEKLEAWKMDEKTKTEKLLAKYLSVCGGKVKAEVLNIEKSQEPAHMVIVKLISTLHIKKLVIGMTLKKSPSWKSKTAISSAIYIQKHKPSFCELFITCRGKLVLVRAGNDQGEYEEEEMAADLRRKMKEKGSFRGWLGRMLLPDTPTCNRDHFSQTPSSSSSSLEKSDSWDSNFEQIETYFQWLSNSVEEIEEEDGDGSQSSQLDQTEEEAINSEMSTPERIEALKAKIEDYKKIAQEKINESKGNVERRQRAEWALSLCDKRIEKLVALVEQEVSKQIDLNRDLDKVIDQLEEVTNDIETSKNRLKTALELEGDLRNVLHLNSTDKLRIEAQLEKALAARAETLKEIEEMRGERDVFRRRNELCREREALSFSGFREFTAEELKEATVDFSERMRIKTGANGFLYRGRIHQTDVAIKLHNPLNKFSCHEFQAKMKVLSSIRHPHLVTIIGACTELKSVVYEYLPHGSLQDVLFPKPNKKKKNSRKKQPPHLPWPARLRILAETASAVGFLHSTRPAATAHRRLRPSNVLLDRNLVAKVADFATDPADPSDVASDIRDLGILMLQMLRGKEEEVPGKGVWDAEVGTIELERIAEGCVKGEVLKMEGVVREMDELGKKLGEERVKIVNGGEHRHDVPSVFLCPITQEVMKDPHVAGDGFSYELEAIHEWLKSGHDTSPMTNLKLKNKILTPNHTLRSLIQDWNCRFRL